MHLWGIDIGEAKLDLAVEPLAGGDPTFFHLPPEGKRSPQRFADLHYRVRRFARPIVDSHPPAVIIVEQPVGRFPNPWLTGAWAVILGAFSHFGVPVWSLVSTDWKKEVGLPGNANKGKVLTWACGQGLEGLTEHQADAVGVVRAARKMMQGDADWQTRTAASGPTVK